MELDVRRMIAAKPREHEMGVREPVMSPWGEALDPEHVLQEFPRPLMRRERWECLNGWWEYAVEARSSEDDAEQAWHDAEPPERMQGRILVPFSPETALSGVGRELEPDELLWYRRDVALPRRGRGERLLLHLEAVDWACAAYVNGFKVGEHAGGYLPADFDITDAAAMGAVATSSAPAGMDGRQDVSAGNGLDAGKAVPGPVDERADMRKTSFGSAGCGVVRIELCVWDPSETRPILRGKQRLDCGNIWYQAQSGIWQTVWLEVVPAAHLAELELAPDADDARLVARGRVKYPASLREPPALTVRVRDGGETVAMGSCRPGRSGRCVMTLALSRKPHLWSCEDPHLYDVEARFGDDLVRSYCAFRTTTIEADERGIARFCLNHEPLPLRGLLDQGYWPESLMTAPSDEALVADIEAARDLGFNMLRKHLKVESARWYWHCDHLGMLVWQDMVSGGGPYQPLAVSYRPTLFRHMCGRWSDTGARHQRDLGSADPAYRQEWIETCEGAVRRLAGHPSIMAWGLFNEGFGQFDAARLTERVRALDPARPVDAASGWYDQGSGGFVSVHNYFRPLAVYPDRKGRRLGRLRAFVISECGGLTLHVEGHSAYGQAYGYEAYGSARQWRGAVRQQLDQLDALWDEGLAGYVWCELSDVEEESNGLLSYDRRVNKLGSRSGPRPRTGEVP